MSAVYCFWHHRYEERIEPYRDCFECGHVYNSAEELIDAYNSEKPDDIAEVSDVDLISFCPFCIHDW